MKTLRIAVLTYRGCMATQLFGLADVLRIASQIDALRHGSSRVQFDVQMVGFDTAVAVSGGLRLPAKRPRGTFDLLIVPGLLAERGHRWSTTLAALAPELAFIAKTFARGTPVASVCVGAFLLGEAGLLDGRQVTTSWLFAKEFATRYPAARLQADAMLLEDGGVITTAAVTSVFDLALHLVKRHLGAAAATATAQATLLPTARTSQAPYVDPEAAASPLPSFSNRLRDWFDSRLAEPYDLQRVARAFHVSGRTLMRRVKAETGDSPLTMLQHARVDKARRLLASTRWSVARITQEVGYNDAATFARLFARRVGEPPSAYRKR
ncbi:GlxA family transcriptional regulator [Piscinibacter gummiphilus]|uniref:Helix-turn-helix domain-containing protein n=1 Tax=Piscinibacter gummiphilus TaxID=946333 RepID=A0ABZ0CNV2_9BURK|nr:helix-turn-helix domain-containing protein [Piscinibacter gummiphilus]WOB06667.1 helix-turn-helix domain-containing protein [Piscinibacter gummiphilus]